MNTDVRELKYDDWPIIEKHFPDIGRTKRKWRGIANSEKITKDFKEDHYRISEEYHDCFLIILAHLSEIKKSRIKEDRWDHFHDDRLNVYEFFKDYQNGKIEIEGFTIKGTRIKGPGKNQIVNLKPKSYHWKKWLVDELLKYLADETHDFYDLDEQRKYHEYYRPKPPVKGRKERPGYIKKVAIPLLSLIEELNIFQHKTDRYQVAGRLMEQAGLIKYSQDPGRQVSYLVEK